MRFSKENVDGRDKPGHDEETIHIEPLERPENIEYVFRLLPHDDAAI
jgi:hypothetical protein